MRAATKRRVVNVMSFRQIWSISALFSVILVGCSTAPAVRVAQPWRRSLTSGPPIRIGVVKIETEGKTFPLLGNERLLADSIGKNLAYLLARRGFVTADSAHDYLVQVAYKTERRERLQSYSSVATSSTSASVSRSESGAGATLGLGVSIARAIGALVGKSETVSQQTTEQVTSFSHTISVEIREKDGQVVWKGESTWDSSELNLISGIIPALQLVLSDLPADPSIQPSVPEVRADHVENYFKLECKDRAFTCPALPYWIWLKRPRFADEEMPREVRNPYALAAYVDLLQTAEYAIPSGDEEDWKFPLQPSLWGRATLIGQYRLGPSGRPVNVVIKLVGSEEGYYLDECMAVSDQEYAAYNQRLLKWRGALEDYYDVYVQ